MAATASHNTGQELSATFVRRVIFPVWAMLDHPAFQRYYREFEHSQSLPQEELRRLQARRLGELLRSAAAGSPFYRARMRDAGLSPDDIRQPEDIRALPVLTKKQIQDHGKEMVNDQVPVSHRVRNQTGGSTGSPLQFYVDAERLDSRMASTVRHDRWAGMRPGDWCAYLWGARMDQILKPSGLDQWKNRLLYRRIAMNTSSVSEQDWQRFCEQVRRIRPRFMLAYAKAAVQFAKYVSGHGLNDIGFESMITTAEVLLPEDREILEKVFRGRVFNRYGCREVSVIASECEAHAGMHVNAEALLVEVVPDREHPAPNGRILVTDLLNQSMPLIRYEIGDVGRWAEEGRCACGRELPRLADVQGRTTDFLVLRDGRRISGPALTLIVADMSDVRQVQFVQHSLDEVILRVVPGNGYGPATAEELQRRLGLYIQNAARLRIEPADDIPPEMSGKYRFVVSTLAPEPHD